MNDTERCVEDLESVIDCVNRHYIYEYNLLLPSGETVGKVGYTIAPKQREREWAETYEDWQGKIKFSYLGTSDIDNNTFFMDHTVHTQGKKTEGWEQVKRDEFPADVHYTKEAYHGATAQNTAKIVKTLREEIRSGKTTAKLYKIEKNNKKKKRANRTIRTTR